MVGSAIVRRLEAEGFTNLLVARREQLDLRDLEAELVFDPTKPDGALRKVLDVTRRRELGWSPTVEVRDGIVHTYEWFLANQGQDLRGMQASRVR